MQLIVNGTLKTYTTLPQQISSSSNTTRIGFDTITSLNNTLQHFSAQETQAGTVGVTFPIDTITTPCLLPILWYLIIFFILIFAYKSYKEN